MGYRYEVQVAGKWYDNKVIFATEKEASQAGYNKQFNWTQCENYCVVQSDEPVNYRYDFDTGAVIHIATEGAPDAR
jgi:hypothetical protein